MLFELKAKDLDGEIKFIEAVANNTPIDPSRFEFEPIGNPLIKYLELFRDEIIEHGITSLFTREPLLEALVAKGTPRKQIAEVLHRYLSQLPVTDELIIVDPYFLTSDDPAAYASFLDDVLAPFWSGLKQLRVIMARKRVKQPLFIAAKDFVLRIVTAQKKVKDSTLMAVKDLVATRAPGCAFTHVFSERYHDRFWISASRTKGILVGASFNGLGKKYAVIERLTDADVSDLVASLIAVNLLP